MRWIRKWLRVPLPGPIPARLSSSRIDRVVKFKGVSRTPSNDAKGLAPTPGDLGAIHAVTSLHLSDDDVKEGFISMNFMRSLFLLISDPHVKSLEGVIGKPGPHSHHPTPG